MTQEEAIQKIAQILESDFRVPAGKIKPESTFRGTFGMDSLDAVDFIYLVSKSVGIKAEVSEFGEAHTVQKVAELIVRKSGG